MKGVGFASLEVVGGKFDNIGRDVGVGEFLDERVMVYGVEGFAHIKGY